MAVETDEDRLAFFDPSDFGETATITITGSGQVLVVPCIFDAKPLTKGLKQNNQFSFNAAQDVSGNKPCFQCRSSDIPGVKNGRASVVVKNEDDAVVFTGSVFDVHHDGTGMADVRMMAV